MKTLYCLMVWMCAVSAVASEGEKFALRYKFHPGETLRWEVEHRSKVRTTISGTTQNADTVSNSVKVWRVTDVRPDGSATFEHSVESVDMRQQLSGRAEVRYNSRTDAKPPVGFEDVAKSIGVPLSVVTMDQKGKILERKRREADKRANVDVKTQAQNEGCMTIPLPDEAVPVGHAWTSPQDIDVPLQTGGVKKIKAVQRFTLEEVRTGVATIRVATEIITPVTDPAIESQLVQRESAGRVRFDIDAGRIIGQQMDIDKHVVGFRGDASSIHYLNRFSEQIMRDGLNTAKRTGKAMSQ